MKRAIRNWDIGARGEKPIGRAFALGRRNARRVITGVHRSAPIAADIKMLGGAPLANPTLVHHRLAKRAAFHLISSSGRPVGEVYLDDPDVARAIGQSISNTIGESVSVLDNRNAKGKPLSRHPKINARRRGKAKRKPRARAASARRNPSGAAAIAQATRTFKKWHGFDPKRSLELSDQKSPRVQVKLGDVHAIEYVSNKWTGRKERYRHVFKSPRPLLCTGPDARGLFIHGGGYKVTERGIEG